MIIITAIILISISAITTVIECIQSVRGLAHERNDLPAALLASIIGVGLALFEVYIIPAPELRVIDGNSIGFHLEDNQTWISIEYSLRDDSGSDLVWVEFEPDSLIKITENPTIVYYRSRFLWKTTDIYSQTAYIDEYGCVYLDPAVMFLPEVQYKTIRAEYNKRQASGTQRGNTYAGHQLDKSDFNVVGIRPDGNEEIVKDFDFSPTRLKQGTNKIEITYSTRVGQRITTEVIVEAEDYSISHDEMEDNGSSLNPNEIGANDGVRGSLDTEEDEDYYRLVLRQKGSVKLIFRHESRASSNAYWRIDFLDYNEELLMSMESSRADRECESLTYRLSSGVYYVRVGKASRYTDDTYELYVDFVEEDGTYETEDNGYLMLATEIQVNSESPYVGSISYDDDLDYYSFSIRQKGKVRVTFTHDKELSDEIGWRITVDGDDADSIAQIVSSGGEAEVSTSFRAQAGNFYVLVQRKGVWSSINYGLKVSFTPENDGYESEPNDDFVSATPISKLDAIIGNNHAGDDVDYYELEYNGFGDLAVGFNHIRTMNSDSLWNVTLIGMTSNDAIPDIHGRRVFAIRANDAENTSNRWTGLSPGRYYLRVAPGDKYSDSDYMMLLAWLPRSLDRVSNNWY